MRLQRNISLMLGNRDSSAYGVHAVELAGGAELATLMEKATTGPVEKATEGCSGGQGGPRAREGHGRREAQWREKGGWPWRVGGTMQREEDGQPR
jgi:hypothetical protein